MARPWTETDTKYLCENYTRFTPAELGRRLNRTKNSVKSKATKLGLKLSSAQKGERILAARAKYDPRYHPWTGTDDQYLRDNYLHMTDAEMAVHLNRTRASVRNRLVKLGLKLPRHIWRQRQQRCWFHKGRAPWNKGIKGIHLSPDTEFKKGRESINAKPDGTITVRRDHHKAPYKFIRLGPENWKPLHRHIWEQARGPIPKSHVVKFKNGNTLDCRLENLTLITRQELAYQNQNHEKSRIGMKNAWDAGRHYAHDTFIAACITRDRELRREILEHRPEMIEIKRAQLKLRRKINAVTTDTE